VGELTTGIEPVRGDTPARKQPSAVDRIQPVL
jgi:hypothetical protein